MVAISLVSHLVFCIHTLSHVGKVFCAKVFTIQPMLLKFGKVSTTISENQAVAAATSNFVTSFPMSEMRRADFALTSV